MPGTSCVKQTSWSYVVKFQSIIEGFKLHAVVISIRFLFLRVNAESLWNVARINGMIKMPYPSQWQCFWTSTRFLELWLILLASFVRQIMTVQLKIDGGKLTFDPPFRELRDILLRLVTDIVQNAAELPRVNHLQSF